MTLPPGAVFYPAPPPQAAGGQVPMPQGYMAYPVPAQVPQAPASPGWPPAPPPQQQPGPRGASLDDVIPPDPTIPPELHGKTWRQGLGYYNVMRKALTTRPPGQQPQGQGGQPQGQSQPQGQPGQSAYQGGQGAQPGQAESAAFFADPRAAIRQVVSEVMAPQLAQSQEQQVGAALQAARAQVPPQAWATLEADVYAIAQATPREQLTTPEAWLTIARYAAGQRALAGQPLAGQPQQNGQQGQYQGGGQGAPGSPERVLGGGSMQSQPPQQPTAQPQPQPYQYFTEAPTARPTAGGPQGADPREGMKREMAKRFGMSYEQYLASERGQFAGEQPQQGGQGGMPQQPPAGYAWGYIQTPQGMQLGMIPLQPNGVQGAGYGY